MADKKVTQLSALATPAGADLLHVIDDVAGTPVNKKMEIATLFANIPSVVALGGTPQAITGTGVTVNATTSITNNMIVKYNWVSIIIINQKRLVVYT